LCIHALSRPAFVYNGESLTSNPELAMSLLAQIAPHIPTVANALLSYVVLGGTDTAVMLAQQAISATGLKVQEFLKLKDDLLAMGDIAEQVKILQANPQDSMLQQQLRDTFARALEQQTAVQVQGDIKAEKGIAAAVINGGTFTFNN
jgi:hypothetical protein